MVFGPNSGIISGNDPICTFYANILDKNANTLKQVKYLKLADNCKFNFQFCDIFLHFQEGDNEWWEGLDDDEDEEIQEDEDDDVFNKDEFEGRELSVVLEVSEEDSDSDSGIMEEEQVSCNLLINQSIYQ